MTRRRNRAHVVSTVVVLSLVGTSCLPPHLASIGGERFRPEPDEARLWNRAEEEQQRIRRSGLVYDDPAFTAYMNKVAQRLLTPDIQMAEIPFKVVALKNPQLNAFAYPNGSIYVHTGILSRMENEAQLATLLGHEMSHVIHRHAVRAMRTVKQQSAMGATMAGVFPVVGLLGALGTTAAITGYSRDLEREADQQGLAMMVNSGYDPSSSSQLFLHIKKDIEEQHIKEPFFFGTHPRIQERIDSYNDLIPRSGRRHGDLGEERFAEMIVPVLIENVKLDLSAGNYDSAQNAVTKVLARRPNHAVAHFLLGETYRQRGRPEQTQQADDSFRQAIGHDSTFAEPYRSIGQLHLKDADRTLSREAFQRYLALNPRAADRAYIEQYLRDLTAN